MNYLKNKFFLLAVIFVILLIIVFLLLISTKKTTVKPSPSLVTPTTQKPTPTLLPIEFTGEKREELPDDEVSQINSAFDLRNQLPITTNEFKLEYDYKLSKFIVIINKPY